MAEKALNNVGEGRADDLASAICNATDAGAKIISMSWGSYFNSSAIYEAINYSYSKGVLLVAAAGNDGAIFSMYPAAYEEVIAVSATWQSDQIAAFSNFGEWIELAAPGQGIYSTMPTYPVYLNSEGCAMNYDYLSGTSMACPHVAGVAALVWSRYRNMSRDAVRQWLRYTSDDLGAAGFDRYYGYGRINAYTSVKTTPAGSPFADLVAVDLETEPNVEANNSRIVRGNTLNLGENNATGVQMLLYANSTIIGNSTRAQLNNSDLWSVDFLWTPAPGAYNLTLEVGCANEANKTDNILAGNATARYPTTLFVPGDYSNLQAAVDESIQGDEIVVRDNCASYDRIIIDKDSMTIRGTGNSTISEISMEANNVTLEGLTIQGGCELPCVEMWHSVNISILGNNITTVDTG